MLLLLHQSGTGPPPPVVDAPCIHITALDSPLVGISLSSPVVGVSLTSPVVALVVACPSCGLSVSFPTVTITIREC